MAESHTRALPHPEAPPAGAEPGHAEGSKPRRAAANILTPLICSGAPISDECRLKLGPGVVESLAAGRLLYLEGSDAGSLYEVESGGVALYVTTSNGHELDVCTRGPGYVVGLECLLVHQYLTSARVSAPSIFRRYDAAEIRQAMERDPARLWNVCRQYLAEILALQTMIIDLGGHTAVERLARHLLDEAELNGGREVRLPWGAKGQLAHHLAISQETLSRLLHMLDRQGIVRLHHGGAEVLDPVRLRSLIR